MGQEVRAHGMRATFGPRGQVYLFCIGIHIEFAPRDTNKGPMLPSYMDKGS